MAKYDKKLHARSMRKNGVSIILIAKTLSVSKGSVSMWCCDVVLNQKQIERLKKQKGSALGRWMGAESNRKKKMMVVEQSRKEAFSLIRKVSNRDLLIAGLCLSWGEGSKTGSRFTFINSDPNMLKIVKSFLIEILEVDRDQIRATIQINHIHKPRIKKITNFWSKNLNLPVKYFLNPYYVKIQSKKSTTITIHTMAY